MHSRERLRVLQEVITELQQELPDVHIGLSLYGSLSKGKELTADTKHRADIDANVFIDEDDILQHYEKMIEDPDDTLRLYFYPLINRDEKPLTKII